MSITKSEVLAGLSDEQKKPVIDYNGFSVISAAPGSGKTRTVVARCQYMILDGINPSDILVFTFTKKAANELKERIEAAIGKEASKITIGTYHGFCNRLLRKYAEYAGRTSNFVIYDEEDKLHILKELTKGSPIKHDIVQKYISDFKSNSLTPRQAQLTRTANGFERSSTFFYESYEKILRNNNAFDFDDLTLWAYLILKNNPEVCKAVNEKYKYIIIDEFQDSNKQNVDFALLLGGKLMNICCVMDSDQSIYGFRGADVENVIDTILKNNVKEYKLTYNYRSTQTIVDAAKNVILNNKSRLKKDVKTTNSKGSLISLYSCNIVSTESSKIAKTIKGLLAQEQCTYKDIAILCRLQYQTRSIEQALLENNIPYNMLGGTPFFCRKEIKDLMAFLKLVYNHKDEEAFKRVVNLPKRGIGDAAIAKILACRNADNDDIIAICRKTTLKGKAKSGINSFLQIIDSISSANIQVQNNQKDVSDILSLLVKNINYFDYLEETSKNDVEFNERKANVNELIYLSTQYETLDDLMNNSLLCDASIDDTIDNAVNIMTMHGSKGLEFKVVFIFGANESIIPHFRSYDSIDSLNEERRLFYVAMTRAKEKLYISFSKQFIDRQGLIKTMLPSRFLKELPKNALSLSKFSC